jgi:hypothetical protein
VQLIVADTCTRGGRIKLDDDEDIKTRKRKRKIEVAISGNSCERLIGALNVQ